jgi:hypothetical protein
MYEENNSDGDEDDLQERMAMVAQQMPCVGGGHVWRCREWSSWSSSGVG